MCIRDRYWSDRGGHSLSRRIRVVPPYINFQSCVSFINELTLEQQSVSQSKQNMAMLPPFILLHMLEFLCCRHVDPMKAQAALYDLQVLVHHDQGVLLNVAWRDISWEILGICQEIAGDYQPALYSYQQSLRQPPFNSIQTATRHRIRSLSVTWNSNLQLSCCRKSIKPFIFQNEVINETQFVFKELLYHFKMKCFKVTLCTDMPFFFKYCQSLALKLWVLITLEKFWFRW